MAMVFSSLGMYMYTSKFKERKKSPLLVKDCVYKSELLCGFLLRKVDLCPKQRGNLNSSSYETTINLTAFDFHHARA